MLRRPLESLEPPDEPKRRFVQIAEPASQRLCARACALGNRLDHDRLRTNVLDRFLEMLGPLRGAPGRAVNVAGGAALFLDLSGDRRALPANFPDDIDDRGDLTGGRLCRRLDAEHLGGDVFRRACGLRRERLDLRRHDRKAADRFACPRRLNGRVERQKIGLAGDIADQFHDAANLAVPQDLMREVA